MIKEIMKTFFEQIIKIKIDEDMNHILYYIVNILFLII